MDVRGRRRRGIADSSDTQRFRVLYDRYVRSIEAYCTRRLAHDRVDDAVAETFLVAWKRIDDVPDNDDALLWLFRVAYRVICHEWRSGARRRRLHDRLIGVRRATSPTPEDKVVNHAEAKRVLSAARALSANDAEILRLLAWENLSHTEIATVLGLSPNAVNQRVFRARKNLVRESEGSSRGPSPAGQVD